MANYTAITPTTLADFASANPSVVPQIWDAIVQTGVNAKEWLSKFQGAGPENVIIEKQEQLARAGNQVNFTIESDLVGDRVLGSTTAIGTEEKENLNTYSVLVDFKRHPVARDRRFESFRGAKAKASMAVKVMGWMARFKQHEALLSLVKNAAYTTSGKTYNLFFSGGGSSLDSLTADTVLDTGCFEMGRAKLVGVGANPANLSQVDGEEIPEFVLWGTSRALEGLTNDQAWNTFNNNARAREGSNAAKNPLLTHSYGLYKGIRAFEVMNPDHDNPKNGAVGSPLEPRALLRTALTGTSVTEINGGGSGATSTAALFFKDFPGYDYLFHSGQTPAADGATYYALILNLPGTTDAGKREVISYTGSANDGNKLGTVTRGLNSQDDDYSPNHAANSLIVPCTKNGIPYAWVPILGRGALLRAYGETREEVAFEEQDYGFIKGACVTAVFGQTPPIRADSRLMNYVMLAVAINPLS